MASIESIRSLVLDTPPSCMEFVPDHPELFVVGTYYLEKDDAGTESPNEKSQQRTGSLLLFRLDGDEVTLQHELTTPFAIFHIDFAPSASADSSHLLGVATSTGSFAFYRISASNTTEPSPPPQIHLVDVLQLFPITSLITHFAWHPTIPSVAALALSDGSIYLCDTSTPPSSLPTDPPSSTPSLIHLHAHSLEAWFVAFTPTALLTGGDDSVLASIPLPPSSSADNNASAPAFFAALAATPPSPQFQDRRTHAAGVTAILPLGEGSAPLVLTGSYDDHIRLVALPGASRRRPAVLAELELGGGVWRLSDITGSSPPPGGDGVEHIILASCMHAGARILRLRGAATGEAADGQDEWEWEFEVLAKFEEHKSMNYGSNVQPFPFPGNEAGGNDQPRQQTVVSTSFYDRLLAVWRW